MGPPLIHLDAATGSAVASRCAAASDQLLYRGRRVCAAAAGANVSWPASRAAPTKSELRFGIIPTIHAYAARVTRQKILITGASSGLGAGMARAFAAKGRDLALCARRIDRLDELKAELLERHPGITVAVAALDVNDHEQVPKVFAELSDELGGIDRVIVNAGIGKGAPLGSGKLWANKATIETNLVAALVQIETAIEMFKHPAAGIWCWSRRCSATRACPA